MLYNSHIGYIFFHVLQNYIEKQFFKLGIDKRTDQTSFVLMGEREVVNKQFENMAAENLTIVFWFSVLTVH